MYLIDDKALEVMISEYQQLIDRMSEAGKAQVLETEADFRDFIQCVGTVKCYGEEILRRVDFVTNEKIDLG